MFVLEKYTFDKYFHCLYYCFTDILRIFGNILEIILFSTKVVRNSIRNLNYEIIISIVKVNCKNIQSVGNGNT